MKEKIEMNNVYNKCHNPNKRYTVLSKTALNAANRVGRSLYKVLVK